MSKTVVVMLLAFICLQSATHAGSSFFHYHCHPSRWDDASQFTNLFRMYHYMEPSTILRDSIPILQLMKLRLGKGSSLPQVA